MSVRFWLRKQVGFSPSRPVSVVLSIRRHRTHRLTVTTAVRVAPRDWSVARERLRPSAPGAVDINAELERLRAFAESMLLAGADDDALRARLKTRLGLDGPAALSAPALVERFDAFASTRAASARSSTMQTYGALRLHLADFVGEQTGLDAIEVDFLERFAAHLAHKGLANTTTNKLLKPAKAFTAWLEAHGEIAKMPRAVSPLKTLRGETVYLTRDELARLVELDLSDRPRGYKAARDLFVAGALTGQRFGDLVAMTWDALDLSTSGAGASGAWVLSTQKTGKTARLPLARTLLRILDERRSEETPLPQLSNVKANLYLKDVARLADIAAPVAVQQLRAGTDRRQETRPKHEVLTTHAARRTFVTLVLQEGASTTDLLGITHADLRALRLYVGESEEHRRATIERTFGGL